MDTRVELPLRERLDPDLHARMWAIAEQALAAGEVLAEEPGFRGTERVPYKYGHHLPNWFNGFSDGYKRELEATLPVSLTFLDNVKGEGLVQAVDLLHRNGVKPYLVFRPYFRPEQGANPAIVEGYANGAVIRMRDDYFQHPLIKQAYDEGRFIVKLFNETNIGGEGFPRGRAGFPDALRYWKQARGVVKAAYPNAKIMSLCNTPGNDDVWFRTDLENAEYWYHGPEAAKANPTPAEIQAAIESCLFREMFLLCDVIGAHVYANLRSTVTGDLKTWYAYRYKQYLKFLKPYIDAGKKMIINEWDLGYDEGQEYRAEAVVFGLAEIIGPDDAILFVNHWWNGDDNEGSGAWEKHQTRKGGQFRPVVNAVKAFRENGTVPLPPPDEPEEPEDPDETPVPPTGDDIRLPAWVRVDRAVVPVGERYWHLKKAYWQDHDQSGGTHHIYVLSPHNPAQTFGVTNGQETWHVKLEKPINEPAGNFSMWKGNTYTAWMDGALSDKVTGMHMPQSQHVNYLFEWELRTKEGNVPPTGTLEDALFAEMVEKQLRITPTFELPKTIIRYNDQLGDNRRGFDFATQEIRMDYGGVRYAFLGAQHPVSEAKVIAYAKENDWRNVKTAVRLKTEVLDIPYRNQLTKGQADYARGDCGPACLAMYYAFKGVQLSVNTLSYRADAIQNDGKPGFNGLTLKEMELLAAYYGTRLVRSDGMTETDVLLELAAYNPILAVYNYDAMPDEHKYDKSGDVGGHYALLKGRKVINGERYVILADPYYPNNEGANRAVRWADFDKAWLAATKNGNPARCGLLFR